MLGSSYHFVRIFYVALLTFSFFFINPVVKNSLIAKNSHKIIHRVKNGENLTSIARKYRVDISDIIDWNRLSDGDSIRRGQKLKILLLDSRRTEQAGESFAKKNLIDFKLPAPDWKVLQNFEPYGDERRYGIFCLIGVKNEVFTASAGKVAKTGYLSGYGKYIMVDHGNGWLTMYSNLSEIQVKTGQIIDRSTAIASADKRRLFFVVSYKGRPLNPLTLVQNRFS